MRNHSAVFQIACSRRPAVLLKKWMPERYCYLTAAGRQRLQAAAASLGKRRRDDTGGVHLMEMHANLRRVEDGQLKADE
jgi:hypothetical protein